MKPEKIGLMPDWPARMGEDLVALYLGCSLTTLRDKVARKLYPQPVREGARKYWSRDQLDRFIAGQFGLSLDGSPTVANRRAVDGTGPGGASSGTWGDL